MSENCWTYQVPMPESPARGVHPFAEQQLRLRARALAGRRLRLEHDRQRARGPVSPQFGEKAEEREDDEVLERLAEINSVELRQALHAIARMEKGLYGTCEICEVPIAAARLVAEPDATCCVGCADGGLAAGSRKSLPRGTLRLHPSTDRASPG